MEPPFKRIKSNVFIPDSIDDNALEEERVIEIIETNLDEFINEPSILTDFFKNDKNHLTYLWKYTLHENVFGENIELLSRVLDSLISLGWDINTVWGIVNNFNIETQTTSLCFACESRDLNLIDLLLEKGADPNKTGKFSPLEIACQLNINPTDQNEREIIKTIINKLVCMGARKELRMFSFSTLFPLIYLRPEYGISSYGSFIEQEYLREVLEISTLSHNDVQKLFLAVEVLDQFFHDFLNSVIVYPN